MFAEANSKTQIYGDQNPSDLIEVTLPIWDRIRWRLKVLTFNIGLAESVSYITKPKW